MIDLLRQEVVSAATTVVVKIGTNVLAAADGTLDLAHLAHLAGQLAALKAAGRSVVVVSSGAIGAGMGRLRLPARPTTLPALQAAAAIGQCGLIDAYDACLRPHGLPVAQLLLTGDDFDDRHRYLNVRNTLLQLLAWNAIPIVNENDTVSTQEIKFGDNDQLAAMVTNLLRAPLLVILSVTDGLYPGDPRRDPSLRPLPTVMAIDEAVLAMVGDSKSGLGTGGMRSKLQAVRKATSSGESVIIADGRRPDVLTRLMAGEPLGTLFPATGSAVASWKRWIAHAARPKGALVVDAGARDALLSKGRSLLPIGVVEVRGEFTPGDVVTVECPAGEAFARGLTNYGSQDARWIAGRPTAEIAARLPSGRYDEVIHRDNLALLAG